MFKALTGFCFDTCAVVLLPIQGILGVFATVILINRFIVYIVLI